MLSAEEFQTLANVKITTHDAASVVTMKTKKATSHTEATMRKASMIMVKMKIRLFWMMIQSLRGLIESRKTTMVMVKKCRITGKRTIGPKSI